MHSQALHLSPDCGIQGFIYWRRLFHKNGALCWLWHFSIHSACSTLPRHSRPCDHNCVTCYQPRPRRVRDPPRSIHNHPENVEARQRDADWGGWGGGGGGSPDGEGLRMQARGSGRKREKAGSEEGGRGWGGVGAEQRVERQCLGNQISRSAWERGEGAGGCARFSFGLSQSLKKDLSSANSPCSPFLTFLSSQPSTVVPLCIWSSLWEQFSAEYPLEVRRIPFWDWEFWYVQLVFFFPYSGKSVCRQLHIGFAKAML